MPKIVQEFYCAVSGDGCGGYFLVKLRDNMNGVHEIVCPNCSHVHRRFIKDGHIIEEGRNVGTPVDKIYPSRGSYRNNPYTKAMVEQVDTKRAFNHKTKKSDDLERISVVIENPRDLILQEHWIEIHGGKL